MNTVGTLGASLARRLLELDPDADCRCAYHQLPLYVVGARVQGRLQLDVGCQLCIGPEQSWLECWRILLTPAKGHDPIPTAQQAPPLTEATVRAWEDEGVLPRYRVFITALSEVLGTTPEGIGFGPADMGPP